MNAQTGCTCSILALLRPAMQDVALSLSQMVGREIECRDGGVEITSPREKLALADDPGAEVVGILVQAEGGLVERGILILPLADALRLVGLLLGRAAEQKDVPAELQRAALAEMGNVAVASFLNVLARSLGRVLLPCPPTVVVDRLQTIAEVHVAQAATADEQVIFAATLEDATGELTMHFWVLPQGTMADVQGDLAGRTPTRGYHGYSDDRGR